MICCVTLYRKFRVPPTELSRVRNTVVYVQLSWILKMICRKLLLVYELSRLGRNDDFQLTSLYRGTYNIEEIMSLASNEDVVDLNNKSKIIQPDDACNIQFTSGTTGQVRYFYVSKFFRFRSAVSVSSTHFLLFKTETQF